jgi:zinc finger BED domain-containing protein 5/7/8/9
MRCDKRYIKDGGFKEEFLFCHALESTTKGEDVLNVVSMFLEEEGLSWDNVCSCTTDGAPSMLGNRSGFRAQVAAANPTAKHLHCMIHRYALASKTLPTELKAVLDDIVAMVNTIKSSALNTRLFRLLCQELEGDQEALLFHTDVRWLSKGNMLDRVESLKEEMAEFFKRNKNRKSELFVSKLSDNEWLIKLAYLNDIFRRINALNKSLQGSSSTILDFVDKVRSFIMKLELWETNIKDGNFHCFENLNTLLDRESILTAT